ncbi:hypothetical protein [Pseudofrankia sp. DC12]|uniref:hypothetical protein n=1 Tax=Pseudofrankia sp. DC12 TaxID=683315 RepID=UPI0005F7D812|nr:hypothetical protein [Pseudofrankia sp. DC12]
MVTADELARLKPEVERRRIALGLTMGQVLAPGTYQRLLRLQPIQAGTLKRLDESLAGTDGGWPAGTAYRLAVGTITRLDEASAGPAHSGSDERDLLYAALGEILIGLASASEEQVYAAGVLVRSARDLLIGTTI